MNENLSLYDNDNTREGLQLSCEDQVKSILPLVSLCNRQTHSVIASQDDLLTRIRKLQELLDKFLSGFANDEEEIETMIVSSQQLRNTNNKVLEVNAKLLTIQNRLENIKFSLSQKMSSMNKT